MVGRPERHPVLRDGAAHGNEAGVAVLEDAGVEQLVARLAGGDAQLVFLDHEGAVMGGAEAIDHLLELAAGAKRVDRSGDKDRNPIP